jgi:glycosyltransferase involved in cell wall biosynthesis
MDISIIICTRNRARSLKQTLEAINRVNPVPGLTAELIVVNNGSTDDTEQVLRSAVFSEIKFRAIVEPRKGLAVARNRGVREAAGEILVFTDDDIVPSQHWLEKMVAPLLARQCEGVAGRIELAPELRRPWMVSQHKVWLAADDQPEAGKLQLVGANMAFHRSVLERVPAFDEELGAGALGSFEETLFSWQLSEAGLRLRYAPDAVVVHYPDASRLLRSSWLDAARLQGVSAAYVCYHWQQEDLPLPLWRLNFLKFKLFVRRLFSSPAAMNAEGIAAWEMSYVCEMEKQRGFLNERRRPRNYLKRALIKTARAA